MLQILIFFMCGLPFYHTIDLLLTSPFLHHCYTSLSRYTTLSHFTDCCYEIQQPKVSEPDSVAVIHELGETVAPATTKSSDDEGKDSLQYMNVALEHQIIGLVKRGWFWRTLYV
jgi:hypothetical protein